MVLCRLLYRALRGPTSRKIGRGGNAKQGEAPCATFTVLETVQTCQNGCESYGSVGVKVGLREETLACFTDAGEAPIALTAPPVLC